MPPRSSVQPPSARNGTITQPSSWSVYHQEFLNVLNQCSTTKRPPSKAIAEVFVRNCRNKFLEKDVLAREPADHRAALELVLDRLNAVIFCKAKSCAMSRIHRKLLLLAAPPTRIHEIPPTAPAHSIVLSTIFVNALPRQEEAVCCGS